MSETPPRNIDLDICGQVCPSTLLVVLREINHNFDALKSRRARLVIKTDNRDATNTIPEAAENMGFQVTVTKSDGTYTIIIYK